MEHNREQIDSIRNMENKLRRRDILAGEEAIYRFYREQLDGLYEHDGLDQPVSDVRTLSRIQRRKGDSFLRISRDKTHKILA